MEENVIRVEGIFEKGYGFISKSIMIDNTLSLGAKAIYAYLCSYSGKGNDIFPSRKKMCADLKISNDTLGKYLKELKDREIINITQEKKDNKFANNIYTINLNFPCTKISVTENLDTNNNIYSNNNINSYIYNNYNNIDQPKISVSKSKKTSNNFNELIDSKNFGNELKNSIKDWLEYKKEKKEPYTEMGFKKLLTQIENNVNSYGENNVIRVIDESMACNYKGILFTKLEKIPKKIERKFDYAN